MSLPPDWDLVTGDSALIVRNFLNILHRPYQTQQAARQYWSLPYQAVKNSSFRTFSFIPLPSAPVTTLTKLWPPFQMTLHQQSNLFVVSGMESKFGQCSMPVTSLQIRWMNISKYSMNTFQFNIPFFFANSPKSMPTETTLILNGLIYLVSDFYLSMPNSSVEGPRSYYQKSIL